MRLQTQWLRWVVGVLTLTTALLFTPAPIAFAQTSLFDPTFNVGLGANGTVYGVVLQDDGKIIVGGSFTVISGQPCTNLARLNADGTLDNAFPQGTDGAIYRMLKQPDGKILVGGAFTNLQGVARQCVGRLLTNGTIDLSFDAGDAIPKGVWVLTLACQSDQKVLAGTVPPSGAFSFLKRLLPTGQLDESFVQTNVFWGNAGYLLAMCPRSDGSILMGGGFHKVNDHSTFGLALIDSSGMIDTEFTSPIELLSHFGDSGVYVLTMLPDNRVLIGGGFYRNNFYTNKCVLARLTSTLNWDSNFTTDVFDSEPSIPGHVMAISLQTNGKIVLGGNFQTVGGYWRQSLVRLHADGHVDPCFDPGIGLSPFHFAEFYRGITSIALQADGKILAGGNFGNQMSGAECITRLLPQTECSAIRVHIRKDVAGDYFVAGTCTPGGTNHLQWSTNLLNWTTAMSSTTPYVYSTFPYNFSPSDRSFFRVKKEY